jgi:hypothetical protein
MSRIRVRTTLQHPLLEQANLQGPLLPDRSHSVDSDWNGSADFDCPICALINLTGTSTLFSLATNAKRLRGDHAQTKS